MIVYSILLFVAAALLLLSGILIFCGRYDLIYDPHLASAKDLRRYTKAYGLATMCLSIPLLACGILQLIPPQIPFAIIGICILVLGILADYLFFCYIEKKYTSV